MLGAQWWKMEQFNGRVKSNRELYRSVYQGGLSRRKCSDSMVLLPQPFHSNIVSHIHIVMMLSPFVTQYDSIAIVIRIQIDMSLREAYNVGGQVCGSTWFCLRIDLENTHHYYGRIIGTVTAARFGRAYLIQIFLRIIN